MKKFFVLNYLFVLCTLCLMLPTVAQAQTSAQVSAKAFLKKYCMDCHSAKDPSGEREFETLDLTKDHVDTQLRLQEIIDQLNLGAMPPVDAEQPVAKDKLNAITQLTKLLSEMRLRTTSTGGQTVLRRLSRREYLNTMRDLLGVDTTMFDPTVEFPAENLTHHADNIGDALVTSGYLLEKYLEAADKFVEKALVDPADIKMNEWTFINNTQEKQTSGKKPPQKPPEKKYKLLYDHPLADKPEEAYVVLEKFPGGVPHDGFYEIKVKAEALNRKTPYSLETVKIDLSEPFRLGIRPGNTLIADMEHIQPIQPLLAEAVIKDDKMDWYTFKVYLSQGFVPRFTFENGMHDVRGVWFRVFRNHKETIPADLRETKGIVDSRKVVEKHGFLPRIRLEEVRIKGPIEVKSNNTAQQVLLSGKKFDPLDVPLLLRNFADRAYRRPATAEEITGLVTIYKNRIKEGITPFEAYKDAIKAALCSPGFLYFSPPDYAQGTRLTDHGIAERLAYFLTSTMPDDALRKLADQGKLSDITTLKSEANRLLSSPASDAFIADFLDSWLNLRSLGSMPPDPDDSSIYYSAGLESEMKQETRLFMRDLISRNVSTMEFLRADYSFVNRDLAKLYGVADQVPADAAAKFQRVVYKNKERPGLLGHASVLTVSANGIETSPVIRGIWLMENILGTPVPPPPDDVPALDPDVRGAKSIRDQLAKHRESEACNQCHRKFDPLGFALEGFDPIGRQREFYDSKKKSKIDTSGVLAGGDKFNGPDELRKLLLKRDEFFVRTVASRLLSHALGRRIEAVDRPYIDRIVNSSKVNDYHLKDLITAVVTSELFSKR